MNLSDLRAILEPYGIRPIKGRSQHFLLDDGVIRRMVEAAGVHEGQTVVEIGPGPGVLTEPLLSAGAVVRAAELDPRLCTLLRDRFGANERFTLLEGDVLRRSNAELSGGASEYIVVANLPYAITSAVITKLLLEEPLPASVTVMIQKEVADRLMGKAEKGEMSSIAVFVQMYARVERVCTVPKGVFLPPPKVDSAVVKLTRRSRTDVAAMVADTNEETFFALVRAAFAAPRKQIKNTLRAVVRSQELLDAALRDAGIDGAMRPERVSVDDWARIARGVTKNGG